MKRLICTAVFLALLAPGLAPAQGDAASGKALYESRCIACHSVEANRIGPRHAGVFGRKAGTVPGYDYSEALAKSTIVWNERTLDAWLENPERLIPGQKMGYQLGDEAMRADIIAYLRSVSRKPKN